MVGKIVPFIEGLNEKQILWILLGITFGLRLYAVLMAKGISYDGAGYGFMARDFIKGDFLKGLSSPLHPLYPFLIALVSPDTIHVEIAGRIISLVFGTITLFPVYYLAREIVGPKGAIFSGLFYSFHPYLVTYSGMLLSEATYWGLLILSVYLFWIGLKKEKVWKISLSGVFLGVAYLTRPEGIGYVLVYLGWIIVDGILKKKWFKAFIFIGVLISSILILGVPYVIHLHRETGQWLISKKAIAVQANYFIASEGEDNRPTRETIEERSSRAIGIGKNILQYIPFTSYHYLRAYHFTLWVFLLFGLIRARPKKQKGEFFIASLVLFHLLSLSTFTSSTIRYSIPLIPLSLFWAGEGVSELRRFISKIKVSKPEIWMGLFLALVFITQLTQGLRPERRHREEQRIVGIWLKENTPKASLIMSNSPQEAFYADRGFVLMPEEVFVLENHENAYSKMIQYAREKRIQYILVDKNTFKNIPDFIKSNQPADLKKIYQRSKKDGSAVFIYEVLY